MATPVTTLEALLRRLAREGEIYDRLPEQRVRCTACGHPARAAGNLQGPGEA